MNEYLRNLNRIEVIETLACTGRCKHCSEGDHVGFTDHVDGVKAAAAVEEICKAYRIESLMVFGGEPLLYPKDVCAIMEAGSRAGIPQREIITNGYFHKDKDIVREITADLAKSGLAYIMLSVDAFHQETIPIEPVMFFANCAKEAGIKTDIAVSWLVSREDNNPYNVKTREIIQPFLDLGFGMGGGNVIWPEGNAKKYLSEYFDDAKEYVNPYEDDPLDIRAVSIEPDGRLMHGNIYEMHALEILESYKPETNS